MWLPVVIAEILLSFNPMFAAAWIWMKYIYSYYWWLADSPLNPTPGLDWWSFNRSLPVLIGMTISLVYCSIMVIRITRKGFKIKTNDGHIKKIEDKRSNYPAVNDADLNPDSSEFMMDELVLQERERVSKIYNGELPQETLVVKNLKKFYIVKKPKNIKDEDDQVLGD